MNRKAGDDLSVHRQDLEAVCKAVIDNFARWQYDDNGPRTGTECIFCSGWRYDSDERPVKHDPDCPVLVALDIRPRKS